MTIEKLLQCSADELEAMSPEEKLEHFKPYLIVTRPELAEKPIGSKSYTKELNHKRAESVKDKALEILKSAGINVKRW